MVRRELVAPLISFCLYRGRLSGPCDVGWASPRVNGDVAAHLCGLPKNHGGSHVCWCLESPAGKAGGKDRLMLAWNDPHRCNRRGAFGALSHECCLLAGHAGPHVCDVCGLAFGTKWPLAELRAADRLPAPPHPPV